MTLQALPKQPEAWRPTPAYHVAALREQSEAKALGTIEDSADEYWADFWERCDTLMLLEYPTPPPAQRILRYNAKPIQEAAPPPPLAQTDEKGNTVMVPQPAPPPTGSWTGQKIDFPQDYDHDMRDWIQIEPVSMRRDQVLREVALLEMQAMGGGMTAPPAMSPLPPATSGVAAPLPPVKWGGG